MTEEELDQVSKVREQIEMAITAVVDRATAKLPPHVDELVRTQLGENYRFWRD